MGGRGGVRGGFRGRSGQVYLDSWARGGRTRSHCIGAFSYPHDDCTIPPPEPSNPVLLILTQAVELAQNHLLQLVAATCASKTEMLWSDGTCILLLYHSVGITAMCIVVYHDQQHAVWNSSNSSLRSSGLVAPLE